MRISTNQIYQRGLSNLLTQQERVLKLQGQLSSGLKVETPSDDPIASAQIELMSQRINTTNALQKNRQSAESALQLEEHILQGVAESLQLLRVKQVEAGNGARSKEDRQALAEEVELILQQLKDYANSKDNNGGYMFSGGQSSTPAISINSSGQYVYNGDSAQRFQVVTGSLQVALNDTGDNVFMRIPNGNGQFTVTNTATPNTGSAVVSTGAVVNPAAYVADDYTMSFALNTLGQMVVMVSGAASGDVIPPTGLPDDAPLYTDGGTVTFNGMELKLTGAPQVGDTFAIKPSQSESVFSTVQRMITNLKKPFDTAVDKAATQTENNQLLAQLDSALNHILSYQSDLGSRQNQLDSANSVNTNLLEISEITLKLLREIDPTEVATQYNLQIVNLEAARQSFVRIQNLSVFNYL